ncbi:hypothetical protein [Acinetobacter bereziniae]|nr:hypothetical protein [Acinetobacter bereziniae]
MINKIKVINRLLEDLKLALSRFSSKVLIDLRWRCLTF